MWHQITANCKRQVPILSPGSNTENLTIYVSSTDLQQNYRFLRNELTSPISRLVQAALTFGLLASKSLTLIPAPAAMLRHISPLWTTWMLVQSWPLIPRQRSYGCCESGSKSYVIFCRLLLDGHTSPTSKLVQSSLITSLRAWIWKLVKLKVTKITGISV